MTEPIILHVDYTFDDLRELNVAHAKRERGRQWWVSVVVLAMVIVIVAVLPQLSRALAPPTAPAPPPPAASATPLRDVCLPLLPYVLMLVTIVVLVKVYARSVYKRAFDERNPLQRRHVIELSPRGVTSSEPLARHEYAWEAFNRWIESPNLLLLYLSHNMMLPLPKRAFASPEEVERCRALLRAMIDTPRSARQAFEVLPAPSAAPLPVPPLPLPIPPLPAAPLPVPPVPPNGEGK